MLRKALQAGKKSAKKTLASMIPDFTQKQLVLQRLFLIILPLENFKINFFVDLLDFSLQHF